MTNAIDPSLHSIRIRPMQTVDIPRVVQIAGGLPGAPHWPPDTYIATLNPKSEPRRVALVAETLEPAAPEPTAVEPAAMDSGPAQLGVIVGFVVASLVAGEAELESIAVAADAQRRGSARHLLSHLIAALKELHVNSVNLEVRASNDPALRLYRKHGFKETGRRPGYYADPVEDAVLMSLDLSQPGAG
jgi:ribosomal-protein-alanine N-acetyltransferase